MRPNLPVAIPARPGSQGEPDTGNAGNPTDRRITEEAFQAEILKELENDRPRLVYADWLDTQRNQADSARAELIRIQCQAAQLESRLEAGCGWDDGYRLALDRLNQRARWLQLQWQWQWLRPLGRLTEAVNYVGFYRGMVDSLDLSRQRFEPETLSALARLPELRRLQIARTNADDRACEHLAKLTNLRRLDISQTEIGDPGLQFLSNLPQLTWIRGRGRLSDAALNRWKCLRNSRFLGLPPSERTQEAVSALERSGGELFYPMLCRPRCSHPGLCQLQPSHQQPTGGQASLVQSELAQSELAQSELAQLHATRTHPAGQSRAEDIPQRRGRALGEAAGGPQAVLLWECELTDPDLVYLSALPSIEELSLASNEITEAGLAYLTQLQQLRSLDLSDTAVSDLSILKNFLNLQELRAEHLHLHETGADSLLEMTQLRRLWVRGTIDEAFSQRLQESLPKAVIIPSCSNP